MQKSIGFLIGGGLACSRKAGNAATCAQNDAVTSQNRHNNELSFPPRLLWEIVTDISVFVIFGVLYFHEWSPISKHVSEVDGVKDNFAHY